MATLTSSAYGKTHVRLMYVDRTRAPHDVRELSVKILFDGEFNTAYTHGDNASVLPTDTMKNTVYVLARQLRWDSSEALAKGIAQHFLDRLPHLSRISIQIEETPWKQLVQHHAAFVQQGTERRTVHLTANRAGAELISGFDGLQILKTAHSAFAGFLKDKFTTLPETTDRLFGTVLKAEWKYLEEPISFNDSHREIRSHLLDCFATHYSLSVQHTLFAMAEATLMQVPVLSEIYLVMPNKHCLLVDLTRFGLDNPNQIFVPTDEPSGYIEARVAR